MDPRWMRVGAVGRSPSQQQRFSWTNGRTWKKGRKACFAQPELCSPSSSAPPSAAALLHRSLPLPSQHQPVLTGWSCMQLRSEPLMMPRTQSLVPPPSAHMLSTNAAHHSLAHAPCGTASGSAARPGRSR